MKTKPMTFDAVAASRQWREGTGRDLDAMSLADRVAFLEQFRAPGADGKPGKSAVAAKETISVREDEAPFTAQPGKESAP